MNPINSVWTEKYRPKKIDGIVGDFKEKIKKYLEDSSSMPHFLFHSKAAGTGKSSLCKAIINELGCDALILNSSDDRKIEVVREKVKEFAMTKSSKQNMRRCCFLDEFDGMLKASQEALRNIMETYSSNVFFILTCNNINKVIEPLQSRCVVIPFAYPEKEEIYVYLEMICKNENMEYNEEGLNVLIDMNYPSIRNCVLALQDLKTEGKSVLKENIKLVDELYERMWKLLQEKNWKDIKVEVMQSTIDPRELNTYFWIKSMQEDPISTKMIQLLCRNERDIALGSDSKIIFVTSLIEMVQTVK